MILTVAGLEVAVDELHGRVLVQVVHAVGDLARPVEQHVGRQVPADERLAHAAAARVLHHQAQVRLGDADRLQLDDVAVVEEPEQLRLATHALEVVARPLAQRTGHLHRHLPPARRRRAAAPYNRILRWDT